MIRILKDCPAGYRSNSRSSNSMRGQLSESNPWIFDVDRYMLCIKVYWYWSVCRQSRSLRRSLDRS